jgi:hypothetical protein
MVDAGYMLITNGLADIEMNCVEVITPVGGISVAKQTLWKIEVPGTSPSRFLPSCVYARQYCCF